MSGIKFAGHLAPLGYCRDAGFEFCETPRCLFGVRRSPELVDMLLVHDAMDARVTRYRRADFRPGESPEPVWCVTGTVAEVVHGALALTVVGAK